jgi:hypothetical protein
MLVTTSVSGPRAFYADLDPDPVKNVNADPDLTRRKINGSSK